MSRGDLNIGRLEGKQILKPRVGKSSLARRRIGRVTSKARRRCAKAELLFESWWMREA
ncbi:MAG TPA: hypothetical protein PK251_10390 [Candidatus Latescibacteria bacterium]|nr:hypothetical protein [Candidatus Latescibacterota bacterium]HOS65149.1 hypothetical protein [Candidatus Latescibacterota bacterium]HPK74275.1 hypothetical protein [Candidatus Latescibacterota bacterium]